MALTKSSSNDVQNIFNLSTKHLCAENPNITLESNWQLWDNVRSITDFV